MILRHHEAYKQSEKPPLFDFAAIATRSNTAVPTAVCAFTRSHLALVPALPSVCPAAAGGLHLVLLLHHVLFQGVSGDLLELSWVCFFGPTDAADDSGARSMREGERVGVCRLCECVCVCLFLCSVE